MSTYLHYRNIDTVVVNSSAICDGDKGSTKQQSEDSCTDRPSSASLNSDFTKALILGVAYSANIGGMGTLPGTGVNIIMKQFADE